jgi:hypothetical protein
MAYLQYAAAFRGNATSADILRFLLPLLGLGAILLGGAVLLEPMARGMVSANHVIRFTLPALMFGTWLSWVGFLNFRWHRQLAAAPVLATAVQNQLVEPEHRRHAHFSITQSLALVAALSAVFAGVSFGYRDIPPQVMTHVSPQEARLDLPVGATDVCIRRGSRGTISYNFATDEAGFWEWAKRSAGGSLESEASGVRVLPITGSFTIYDTFAPNGEHTITRGWFYDFHVEDRGHQYAFDADEGRVYFSFHAY